MAILDLQFGQADGPNVLREIGSRSDVPVIIITWHRRDEIDRVVVLQLGADDYIPSHSGFANCPQASTLCCADRRRIASPHNVS
jgi:DNA-binding response OmpR family regulator